MIEKCKKVSLNAITNCMSPQSAKISRVEGLESPLGTSFIRRKSSEIRKLFPNSPQKCISVLKHIWDQMYKSPRKRHYIRKLWPLDQKEFAAFMLKVGKQSKEGHT